MVDLTGYKLTFDDEFSQLSVSQDGQGTVWADIRPDWRLNANADIGFGDSAFVDPGSGIDPFSIQNGALNIQAVQTSDPVVGPGQWASGLLETQNAFSQEYGYFEIRAQLPPETGVWPAFWMMPENDSWPPELDVFEVYGTSDLYQAVHTGVTGTDTYQTTWSNQPSMLSGFHTYGVLWDADQITFYFDGQAVGQQSTPADFHQAMYLLIDLAMQPLAGVSSTPKSMQVDYVRAYSSDPNATAVPLGTVSSPDGLGTADLHGATAAPAAPPARAGALLPSEILLCNGNDGRIVEWQMAGAGGWSGSVVDNPGAGWSTVGFGDFDGDGQADFLLGASDGTLALQSSSSGFVGVGNPGPSWSVGAVGDLEGDGKTDIVLRHTDGTLVEWQLQSASGRLASSTLIGNPGADWTLAGIGDFAGNGASDLLLRNTDGTLVDWQMSGATLLSSTPIGNPGADWTVAGLGDFNGDGTSDILLRNTDGTLVEWQMHGPGRFDSALLGNPGAAWKVAQIGDFNGDGRADILLAAADGTLVDWQMNGAALLSSTIVGNPGAGWTVV